MDGTVNLKPLKVDVRNLYTKTAYSRAYGVNRTSIDLKIKSGEIKTIPIQGATLILVA